MLVGEKRSPSASGEMAGCLTRGSLKLPCRPIERRDSQYCKLQNDNAGSPDQAVWHNNI
jgi:hypothetical protein